MVHCLTVGNHSNAKWWTSLMLGWNTGKNFKDPNSPSMKHEYCRWSINSMAILQLQKKTVLNEIDFSWFFHGLGVVFTMAWFNEIDLFSGELAIPPNFTVAVLVFQWFEAVVALETFPPVLRSESIGSPASGFINQLTYSNHRNSQAILICSWFYIMLVSIGSPDNHLLVYHAGFWYQKPGIINHGTQATMMVVVVNPSSCRVEKKYLLGTVLRWWLPLLACILLDGSLLLAVNVERWWDMKMVNDGY